MHKSSVLIAAVTLVGMFGAPSSGIGSFARLVLALEGLGRAIHGSEIRVASAQPGDR